MPTYEFECKQCHHIFTAMKKIDDREEPLKEPCPSCSAEGSVQRYYAGHHNELSDPWRLGYKKPNRDWREFLGKMESANPGCSVNSQL